MTTERLSAADMELLAFERTPWKYIGAKEAAVLERFDVTLTAYYARLNRIIDDPAAEVYDPELVRRLRRQRDARATGAYHKRLDRSTR